MKPSAMYKNALSFLSKLIKYHFQFNLVNCCYRYFDERLSPIFFTHAHENGNVFSLSVRGLLFQRFSVGCYVSLWFLLNCVKNLSGQGMTHS